MGQQGIFRADQVTSKRIPVGKAALLPIEIAGESSPHAASVFFARDGRAKRALRPAMTQG